nr:retrotransposon Orf1 [Tanacetum cinerariifolium]
MPYRIYETLGREEMKKIDKGITMINHTQAEAMGKLYNVLCQVGVTTINAKFLILDIPIDRDAPILVGQGFLYTIGSILNIADRLFSSFDGEHTTEKLDHHDPNTQDNTKQWKRCCFHKFTTSSYCGKDVAEMLSLEIDDMLRIRLHEVGSDEEIFTYLAWIRAFNINEPIYVELCHEFYSTYKFDEVCASDKLQSKKIIRFRLGGRAHNLTLLKFAQRLGLYQVTKLEEEDFRNTRRRSRIVTIQMPRQHETVEEVLLPQVRHEFLLWEGCSQDAKS